MSTAGTTRTTCTTASWACGSSFRVLRWVDASFDSRLQFFDIRQLLLAGRHWRGLGRSIACPI
ncbi:MAG: hypothetical protein CFE49_00100 [Pseudomonas sp. PGPPP3]|nr:MAG: hypothetical protein CFE49_00100 [Pseudomonas sp. PGPPP3]